MPDHWIAGAIKKPGALHRELGVPQGQKIPQGKLAKAAGASGKLGKRARLAETLEGMHHAKGAAPKHDPKTMSHRPGQTEPVNTDRGQFAFRRQGRGR